MICCSSGHRNTLAAHKLPACGSWRCSLIYAHPRGPRLPPAFPYVYQRISGPAPSPLRSQAAAVRCRGSCGVHTFIEGLLESFTSRRINGTFRWWQRSPTGRASGRLVSTTCMLLRQNTNIHNFGYHARHATKILASVKPWTTR